MAAVARALALLWLVALTLAVGYTAAQAQSGDASANDDRVREIVIDGAIGPATSAYVERSLYRAAQANAPLVILRLDTPGGLDSAMRDIVQAVLASPVPVAAYVGPSGARAASAGTYILYASHIAAMAPATNLGAATPVTIGPGSDDEASPEDGDADTSENEAPSNATAKQRKRLNDAVAYIRSLAEKRGRNADWAERAVRQGVSLSAAAALDQGVVDYVVDDERALLDAIDGQRVATVAGTTTLAVAGRAIETEQPGWRTELLSIITDPTIAYVLLMIGIYGLILEGLNPGGAVPGVIGAISLLCALFAFQVLPVNYAGLALIVLGVALMIAEMFAPSFGILGLGGVAAFVFGSIMLMDTEVPGFDISVGLIAAIAVASALLLMLIIYLFLSSRRRHVHTGREGLLGERCVALEDFENGRGYVLLQGESWAARSDTPVRKEQALVVTAVEGLTVQVRLADEQPGTLYGA